MTTMISTAERVAAAEVELAEATSAHQTAREASEASRATLAALEAAADRRDDVNTTAKSDQGLKSRLTAALDGKVAAAQAELDAAHRAALVAETCDKAETLPDTGKARAAAQKALGKYLNIIEARRTAVVEFEAEFQRMFGETADRCPGLMASPCVRGRILRPGRR